MKEIKKVIVNILKKRKERGDKFENQVLALAIKQMDVPAMMDGACSIQRMASGSSWQRKL